MTLYNTNISKNYGMSSGFQTKWSGVREIIQNALDAHDSGYKMTIEHGKAKDKSGEFALKITNHGITLNQDTLVLGFSTKTGDVTQRGEHGEGLVVGINALLNCGCSVWIRNGDEIWVPQHIKTDSGLEKLVIDIRKSKQHFDGFLIEIKGVSLIEWEAYKENLLFFHEKINKIDFLSGHVLTDEKYRNKLFVKGIYVSKLPDNYAWGYDLDLQLNRDREIANPWKLRDEIKTIIKQGVINKKFKIEDMWDVLSNEDCGEAYCFRHIDWDSSTEFNEIFVEHFENINGPNAIAVTSIGDSARADHFGLKGVVVSQAIRNILESKMGKIEDKLNEQGLSIKQSYNYGDLSVIEKENLNKIVNMVSSIEDWVSLDIINIVEFYNDSVCGSYKNDKINLAKNVLLDFEQLLITLVHEAAHRYGKDGEHAHNEKQLLIMAKIIQNMQ